MMKKKLLLALGALLLIVGFAGIASSNAASPASVAEAKCQKVRIVKKARLYNRRGLRKHHRKFLRRGKVVYLLGTRNIHGKNYYRIGKNSYIRVSRARLVLNPKFEINTDANVADTDK